MRHSQVGFMAAGAAILSLVGTLGTLVAGPAAQAAPASVRLLDTLTVPAGTTRFGMPFRGLSGIDYDPRSDTYVALSDDRSENGQARFYTLRLPLDGNSFADREPTVDGLTVLADSGGQPFARKAVDPEAVRWSPDGKSLFWTSEGASTSGQPAFVREASASGGYVRALTLPDAYRPSLSSTGTLVAGVRNNQALEGLSFSPDGSKAVTITENALVQDGPAAGLAAKSPSRLLVLDRETGAPDAEYVYQVDPIADAPTAPLAAPINTHSADRGVSEILAINETDYITVERSFASGVGFSVRLYWTSTLGATDVRGEQSLSGSEKVMPKKLLYDLTFSGVDPDNVEGITWGPKLADGSRSLVLVADDNFGFNGSVTKIHLISVRADLLARHTPDVNGDGTVNARDLAAIPQAGAKADFDGDGRTDAEDIALWISYTRAFPVVAPPPSTVNLQLLSFNDFHGNLEPPTGRDATLGSALDPAATQVGGVEYLAAKLKQLRQGTDASLTVAAGDIIGASPFLSGLFHDEPTVESMEKLGLDVTSVGNHEFDEGTDELLRMQHGGCHPKDGCYIKDEPYDGAAFPWLAANVVDRTSGKPILAPTWIKRIDGVPVGFIGMTLEGTPGVTGQSGIRTVRFLDEVATARAWPLSVTSGWCIGARPAVPPRRAPRRRCRPTPLAGRSRPPPGPIAPPPRAPGVAGLRRAQPRPRHQHQIARAGHRQRSEPGQPQPLRGGGLIGVRHEFQPVVRAQEGRRVEHLHRTGQIQKVHLGKYEHHDPAGARHVLAHRTHVRSGHPCPGRAPRATYRTDPALHMPPRGARPDGPRPVRRGTGSCGAGEEPGLRRPVVHTTRVAQFTAVPITRSARTTSQRPQSHRE